MPDMKVVFHVSTPERWAVAFANILNLKDAEPDADIIIVLNSAAVSLFKSPSDELLSRLEQQSQIGASIRLCRNSLNGHGISEQSLPDKAEIVPAGIVELIRLQKEGYAYISP